MPLTREEKAVQVADLKEKLARARVTVLTDFRGLDVAAMTRLRCRIREAGGQYRVVKNTLARRAAGEAGIEGLDPYLTGPVALAFGFDDPVALPRIFSEFVREFKQLEIKGGILEGRVVPPEAIRALADLPPREVLLAQVVGGFQAPLAGLVGVLQGTIRKLVYVLEAVREKKAATA
ncbi:MAG: 50S ribosomal protein L10 [Bacillota bacterium]